MLRCKYLKCSLYSISTTYSIVMVSRILKQYFKKQKTPLKLNFLYQFGNTKSTKNIIHQSAFLHEELSIRISHRIIDLIKLPYGLPLIPDIKNVIDLYTHSFERIQQRNKPTRLIEVETFAELLGDIKTKHKDLETTISNGLKQIDNPFIDNDLMNTKLDSFFVSRIGIRTLISQHNELVFNKQSIIEQCNINDIVMNSIHMVSCMARDLYGESPIIKLKLKMKKDIQFPYIPGHIFYIINEILKNSVVAHYKQDTLNHPIYMDVTEGERDIIIKISDMGGGFSRDKIKDAFTYSYSTSPTPNIYDSRKPIISGLGFGLPTARLYARYFGGELIVNPMENYGTDVYVYIHKLGNNVETLY